jgi:hypothetical protein
VPHGHNFDPVIEHQIKHRMAPAIHPTQAGAGFVFGEAERELAERLDVVAQLG